VTPIRSRSVAQLGAIVIAVFLLFPPPSTPELPQIPGIYDGADLDDLTDTVYVHAVTVVATETIVSFTAPVTLSVSTDFRLVGTRHGPAVGLRGPPAF
jgi:hypothetical protein